MTMPKFAKEEADQILNRLDRMAHTIQTNYKTWGMPFAAAKSIVNDLDKTADEIEKTAFGDDSFQRRIVEVAKTAASKSAEVIQREPDEPYMDTFKNPQAPVQIEADEPYMKEYAVDQSSEVNHGKSTTGRPLAP
jgi:hypothetical protein